MVQSVHNLSCPVDFSSVTPALKPAVCIFGAGAVGQFLAVSLEQHCRSLTLCCSNSTFKRIQTAGGILLKDVPREKEVEASNFKLLDSSDLGNDLADFDVVLSCVKAHQLPSALRTLKQLVGPKALLVTIQNGLPFHHGHLTSNSKLSGRPLEPVDPAGELFNAFNRHQESDMLSIIWSKLLDSAIINPTNALTHGPVNALVQSDMMTPLIEGLAEEVMTVGKEVGAKYEWNTPAEWRAVCASRFPACKFSMLQDVEAGRQMEVAPLVAAVIHVAQSLNIPTPRLDILAALISHYNSNIDVQPPAAMCSTHAAA